MFRSFMVSTMALTWFLFSATPVFVPPTVPVVLNEMAVVLVPPVGYTRSLVFSNSVCAAMSKAFFASFLSTLLMTSLTGCSDRSSSLPE